MNQAPKDPARAAAIHLLSAAHGGAMIATARGEPWFTRLDAPVQARALRLADTTLRGASRVDGLWQPLVSRKPAPRVAAALRLGLVESLALEAPAYAVVGDMVAALKTHPKTRNAAGMVNAVLRKALADAPGWSALPAPKLAQPLRKRLRQAWGAAATQAMVTQWAQGAVPIDLCVKDKAPDWAARLGGQLLPHGAVRLAPGTQISALEGFAEGAFWVQDAAAQLAVGLSGIKAGDHVADLCAAPGGKTMQLAALGARVSAVDNNPARLKRLAENLRRTGLQAQTHTSDVLAFPGQGFDAVVLDAPCSATGTLRRHPELPAQFAARDVQSLVALQAAMLDHAAAMLRPGGRLVYVTCSILPEEGEAQIAAFQARHAGFQTRPITAGFAAPFLDRSPPYLRSLPCDWAEHGGMDGFFVAVLDKG